MVRCSMNNLVAVNVPPARRATALGTAFSGFHSGALLTRIYLCKVRARVLSIRSLYGRTEPEAPVTPSTGNLLGLVLSPLLLQAYGWRSLFLIFGVLGGPLLLMWNLCVPAVQQPEPATAASAAFQRPAGGAYRPVPSALLLMTSTACHVQSVAWQMRCQEPATACECTADPATMHD